MQFVFARLIRAKRCFYTLPLFCKAFSWVVTNKVEYMKKLFLVFLTVMLAISAQAQSKHLEFEGVPIDGTLEQFVDKMVSKGFVYIETKDGTAFLYGEIAGYEDCLIGVKSLKNNDLVSCVLVFFPENDTWRALVTRYGILQFLLTGKYGKPEKVVEEFKHGDPKNDLLRWVYLMDGHCNYSTLYSTDKGDIVLTLMYESGGQVALVYLDRINSESQSIPEEQQSEEQVDYSVIEIKPTFQGGDTKAFTRWVSQNVVYPKEAKEKGVSGRVIVQFVIDLDGSVTDVKVLRGVNPLLDAEAVRVVSSSPKWTPGKQRNKPVRVLYTIPITFSSN